MSKWKTPPGYVEPRDRELSIEETQALFRALGCKTLRNRLFGQPVRTTDSPAKEGTSVNRLKRSVAHMEDARSRVVKHYLANPGHVGKRWVIAWTSHSPQVAITVRKDLLRYSFPSDCPKFKWILSRRGATIYVMALPLDQSTWTEDQAALWSKHAEKDVAPG